MVKSLILALATVASLALCIPEPANAAVCARGAWRAGCVGPRGGIVVRHGPFRRGVVVHRRYW
jgi:hypothetical protein